MELIKPSHKILGDVNGVELVEHIERCGRTAYKSEDKITPGSAEKFVAMLIKRGHLSCVEHSSIAVRFTVDRGCTHCLVRYRMSSFTQESTRYVNYRNRGLRFVIPPWINIEPGVYEYSSVHDGSMNITGSIWLDAMLASEYCYNGLVAVGWTPEKARTVLPNSVAAEIVMTTNVREWRHFLSLEADKPAHPQMRELAQALLIDFKKRIPVLFDDILPDIVPVGFYCNNIFGDRGR